MALFQTAAPAFFFAPQRDTMRHKGVKAFWPDAVIQDCVIHKERNIQSHLRKGDHGECSRLFNRMRLVSCNANSFALNSGLDQV
ncbi:MAG: hypothetical protein WCO68_11125, partial [Verrucomicrobiota bacterium]